MGERSRRMSKARNPKKKVVQVRTTVGELLSAAYEAAGCRADRAADLLQRGPLGRLVGPRRLRFV